MRYPSVPEDIGRGSSASVGEGFRRWTINGFRGHCVVLLEVGRSNPRVVCCVYFSTSKWRTRAPIRISKTRSNIAPLMMMAGIQIEISPKTTVLVSRIGINSIRLRPFCINWTTLESPPARTRLMRSCDSSSSNASSGSLPCLLQGSTLQSENRL